MKKKLIFTLTLAVLFIVMVRPVELDKKNLKGLNYVRIQSEFNGVPYYRGYKSPKDQEVEEFNLEETETRLNKAGIPLSKDNIRAVYDQLAKRLSASGVEIVKIRNQDEKNAFTIIPTVSINVEVMAVPGERYFILVYLTVSRWISTWSDTQNLHTPVIIWWQKKMLAATKGKLNKSLAEAADTLIDDFLVKLGEENREEKE